MSIHDIIVIGASAGGIEPLQRLVSGLPDDLPASVFVVVHIPRWQNSHLPEILTRSGPLPAAHPRHGEKIEPGRIYVAPPDYHILLENDHVECWRGPRENRHRPSINPLFRSAAIAYRERVLGVILSGCLDDGSAGLWWVKHYGGIAIVQDPMEAAQPEMPQAALQYVDVDFVAGGEMAALLTRLARGEETANRVPARPEK